MAALFLRFYHFIEQLDLFQILFRISFDEFIVGVWLEMFRQSFHDLCSILVRNMLILASFSIQEALKTKQLTLISEIGTIWKLIQFFDQIVLIDCLSNYLEILFGG